MGGLDYEHNQGRIAVEKRNRDAVETVFSRAWAEGPRSERVIDADALDGCGSDLYTSFG